MGFRNANGDPNCEKNCSSSPEEQSEFPSSISDSSSATSTPAPSSGCAIASCSSDPGIPSEFASSWLARMLRELNERSWGQIDEEDGLSHCLDIHAAGACRADERLRPLFRWNLSCFGTDGHFLGRLGVHFKAKEVARLARCLAAPLVSLRAGKIIRHGQLLRPTSTRGHLDLAILPSSHLQLSFTEDSGTTERLAVLTPMPVETPVELKKIPTDSSGRSFVFKLPANRSIFFWHSEKSQAVGDDLVNKMMDILKQRPTLCQLTGIHESRLESMASYLRAIFPPSSDFTSNSTSVAPGSLAFPGLSFELACTSSSQEASASVYSSTTGETSVVCSSSGAHLLSSLSSEFSKDETQGFTPWIPGSLPQTFTPFPLLVSGSPSAGLFPASPLYSPSYCPCPIGSVSALQGASFTSPHLPSFPALSAVVSAAPTPPLLPPRLPDLYSVPLMTSSGQEAASGPLIGLMLPGSFKSESGVFGADVVRVYNSAQRFSSGLEDFDSRHGFTSLFCDPGSSGNHHVQAAMAIVPGVLSSSTLSRVIASSPHSVSFFSQDMQSFCPDRISSQEVVPVSIPLTTDATSEACICSGGLSAATSSMLNDLHIHEHN